MSIGDVIRYIVVAIFLFAAGIFGLGVWKKQKLEKEIVRELRVLCNSTSSFEQPYAQEAQSALFKAMAYLHQAEDELKKEPGEILEKVFHGNDEGALFGARETGRNAYNDPRAALIRDGLLRNYQHCRTLGLFGEDETVTSLQEGKAPDITTGQAAGSRATIRYIIDPKVFPGVDKLVPNFIVSPPVVEVVEKPTDFEIKMAKELAGDLLAARLIEREAEDRIVAHYDQVNAPPEPEPEPEPDPEPEPKPEPEPAPKEKPDEDECPFGDPLSDN